LPNINIRITEAQKAELEARSGGSTSDYVRSLLFGEQAGLEAVLDRIDHLADDIAEGRLLPVQGEPASGRRPTYADVAGDAATASCHRKTRNNAHGAIGNEASRFYPVGRKRGINRRKEIYYESARAG